MNFGNSSSIVALHYTPMNFLSINTKPSTAPQTTKLTRNMGTRLKPAREESHAATINPIVGMIPSSKPLLNALFLYNSHKDDHNNGEQYGKNILCFQFASLYIWQ
jgi:hypothetical protein